MRKAIYVFLVLLLYAATFSAQTSDDFYPETTLGNIWTFQDNVGDCSYNLTGYSIELNIPAGTSHDPWNSPDAAMMLQDINGTFDGIKARFLSVPDEKYELQGLVLQESLNEYLRTETHYDGNNVRLFIVYINGSPDNSTVVNLPLPGGVPEYQKLESAGADTFVYSYSYDNTNWTDRLINLSGKGFNPVKSGFFAGNAGPNPEFTAEVDWFYNAGESYNIYTEEPIPILPVNGSNNTNLLQQFRWTDVSYETGYLFELATDAGFTDIVLDSLLGSGTTTLDNGSVYLMENTTYYWRVKALADGGSSDYVTGSFNTIDITGPALAVPVGGNLVYRDPVYFAWAFNGNWTLYNFKLYLADNPGMTGAAELDAGNNTYYNLPGLPAGETYYWQVQVETVTGIPLSISAVESFTISDMIGTPVPEPVFPVDNTELTGFETTLYWSIATFNTSLTYDVEVKTGGNVTSYNNVPYAALSISGLEENAVYSWRVRSAYGADESAWSPWEQFVTPDIPAPSVPVVTYPKNGVTVYSDVSYLYWYVDNYSAALTYELEIDAAPLSNPGTADITGISSLYETVNNLAPGETYYWRVRATNGSETSDWSQTAEFTVYESEADYTPQLVYPNGQSGLYSRDITLSWYTDTYNSSLEYDIEIIEGMTLTGTPTYQGISDIYYTVDSLGNGNTYTWAVRPVENGIPGAWSDEATFSVSMVGYNPLQPKLFYPVNQAVIYAQPFRLSWYVESAQAGNYTYTVEYSTDASFNSGVTSEQASDAYLDVDGLNTGVVYYWRVTANYYRVLSAPSASGSFIIDGGNQPVIPVAGSPARNADIATSSPLLSWFTPLADNAEGYELEYSTDAEFSTYETVDGISGTTASLQGLEAGQKYYWRVRAVDHYGTPTAFSGKASFTVNSATSVSSDNIVPDKFEVSQNYPNPFNPSTNIVFAIPEAGNVKIAVHNILGEEVQTIVNKNFTAGSHSVKWDASEFASGVYIYRVSANGKSIAKKMMLIK